MTSAHRKRKARSERRDRPSSDYGLASLPSGNTPGQCFAAHGWNDQRTAGKKRIPNGNSPTGNSFSRRKTGLATNGSITAEKRSALCANTDEPAFFGKRAHRRLRTGRIPKRLTRAAYNEDRTLSSSPDGRHHPLPLTARRASVYIFVENNLAIDNEQFLFQRPWLGQ